MKKAEAKVMRLDLMLRGIDPSIAAGHEKRRLQGGWAEYPISVRDAALDRNLISEKVDSIEEIADPVIRSVFLFSLAALSPHHEQQRAHLALREKSVELRNLRAIRDAAQQLANAQEVGSDTKSKRRKLANLLEKHQVARFVEGVSWASRQFNGESFEGIFQVSVDDLISDLRNDCAAAERVDSFRLNADEAIDALSEDRWVDGAQRARDVETRICFEALRLLELRGLEVAPHVRKGRPAGAALSPDTIPLVVLDSLLIWTRRLNPESVGRELGPIQARSKDLLKEWKLARALHPFEGGRKRPKPGTPLTAELAAQLDAMPRKKSPQLI
jgi:hypothetical protein